MLRKTINPILPFLLLISLCLPIYVQSVCARSAPGLALSQAQTTNSWNGLVPLRSTRVEVEKILGNPTFSFGTRYRYENENEKAEVIYSPGSCELIGTERWNVPKDVVIWMEVYPRKTIPIRDLHLNPKKYRRFQGWHPENLVRYENEEEGVIVHAMIWAKAEELYFFEYQPTPKDGALKCK